jgi:RNA polymerase sigma factor (TIGR02999 family)
VVAHPSIPETPANRLIAPFVSHSHDFTVLLHASATGDRAAFDRAFSVLYDELTRLASAQRRRWTGNETMSTTVLVHEAYLKLSGSSATVDDRAHFMALAARVMRQVLVTYAEAQQAAKRGGDEPVLSLDTVALEGTGGDMVGTHESGDVIALDDALKRLERVSERQARIVECRFFSGFSIPETAQALGISPATVKREWQVASEWLQRELS